MQTYDKLKGQMQPVGTYACYCSAESFPDIANTATVTITQWEQHPKVKSKTRLPRYKDICKMKCDRANAQTQHDIAEALVLALNKGVVLDIPKNVTTWNQWLKLADMLVAALPQTTLAAKVTVSFEIRNLIDMKTLSQQFDGTTKEKLKQLIEHYWNEDGSTEVVHGMGENFKLIDVDIAF